VTRVRAALIAAAVAAACYLTALGNRFALDDAPIVERNPAAHSISTALSAFDEPYWPPEHGAGLWRPLVVLSFAVDWSLSGGSPIWLHAANALWHAGVTALVVVAACGFVAVPAALAGGLLFAVHPVHVEAVANLVGRAELLAAFWLLAALLLARAARRRRADGRRSAAHEGLLVVAVAAALLSKEHAAIAVAVLALDDLATRDSLPSGLPIRAYVAVAGVTVLWFLAHRRVEAGLSFDAVAPTFFGLDTWGRISTMLPVVLVLARLLVWPFDLSPDYHPRVVERLEALTPLGVLGAVLLAAVTMLAVLAWRRDRAASAGLFLIGMSWLPTSNLMFPTGIVIAERTLYLPSVGIALLAAAAARTANARLGIRRVLLGAALLCVPLALRTLVQNPAWADNRALVLRALRDNPSSYRVHLAAARVFRRMGQLEPALREYRLAAELYPRDHYTLAELGSAWLEARDARRALGVLRRAEALDSSYTVTQQLLATTFLERGLPDSAIGHARRAVAATPVRVAASRVLAASFVALGHGDSALSVWDEFVSRGGRAFERWLFMASTQVALGRLESARVALDSALRRSPGDSISQRQIEELRALIGADPRPR
jgi:tetratricopeptide (TPR) repeat protein